MRQARPQLHSLFDAGTLVVFVQVRLEATIATIKPTGRLVLLVQGFVQIRLEASNPGHNYSLFDAGRLVLFLQIRLEATLATITPTGRLVLFVQGFVQIRLEASNPGHNYTHSLMRADWYCSFRYDLRQP